MTVHALFPTLVYAATLQKGDARDFNRQLLKECRQLREDDAADMHASFSGLSLQQEKHAKNVNPG